MSIASRLYATFTLEFNALQAAHVKFKSLFGAVLGNRSRCELADKSDCGHNVTLYIVDCFHASAVGVFGHGGGRLVLLGVKMVGNVDVRTMVGG